MNEADRPLLPLVLADVPTALRRILSQEGIPHEDVATAPTAGRFVLFDSRRVTRLSVALGQETIDIETLRREFVVDPFVQLDDATTARTGWQVGPWLASEETARINKGELREQVLTRLRRQLERRGGVWMRLTAVPYPYRTAFNFRFDHDEYVAEDFAAVMNAIAGHERATTHFVCASTHEHQPAALQRLRGCDVGSHGYRHHTYADFSANRLNISRGIESLRRLGLEPTGFAAPHGRYHSALTAAMSSLGITHSSEFSAAFDDLPYQPVGSVVLQIPIHPVCLGIVLESVEKVSPGNSLRRDEAAEAVADYFIATAEAKRAAGELIFLYGHPDGRLGRYPQVLRRLLTAVAEWPDVWQTSLSEFHRWWRARSTTKFNVTSTAAGYQVQASALPTTYPCGLQWVRDDGVASLPLTAEPQSLFQAQHGFTPLRRDGLPRPIRSELPRGWKDRLRRALDWEYVTPVDEIDVSRWRGRVKRSLRRWKARAA
jgi:hypothetical protein